MSEIKALLGILGIETIPWYVAQIPVFISAWFGFKRFLRLEQRAKDCKAEAEGNSGKVKGRAVISSRSYKRFKKIQLYGDAGWSFFHRAQYLLVLIWNQDKFSISGFLRALTIAFFYPLLLFFIVLLFTNQAESGNTVLLLPTLLPLHRLLVGISLLLIIGLYIWLKYSGKHSEAQFFSVFLTVVGAFVAVNAFALVIDGAFFNSDVPVFEDFVFRRIPEKIFDSGAFAVAIVFVTIGTGAVMIAGTGTGAVAIVVASVSAIALAGFGAISIGIAAAFATAFAGIVFVVFDSQHKKFLIVLYALLALFIMSLPLWLAYLMPINSGSWH